MVILRVKLDILVDEIKMIMRELHQNMHFYDTRSTRYLPGASAENFQKAEKIEVFIAYILHYKSDLFRRAPSRRDNNFEFGCTNLSSVFISYDFFEYSCGNRQVFFYDYQRYSINLQMFVNVLYAQNSEHKTAIWIREQVDSYGNTPTYLLTDDKLSNSTKENINLFVNTLRSTLTKVEHEKKLKVLIKKTNTKFRDYNNYIDEIFDKYGDLSFVCVELSLGAKGLNTTTLGNAAIFEADSPCINLAEFKDKFLNNARNVDPLSRMVGYIGKWEWSVIKYGLYFRIIFIFPTSELGDMSALQHEINFYWCEKITFGHGLCHHAPIAVAPAKFKKPYCHIKKSNVKEREAFKERAVGYITKSEKFYYPVELKNLLNSLKTEKVSERELSLTFRSKSKKNKLTLASKK